jgi:hypothetical protein
MALSRKYLGNETAWMTDNTEKLQKLWDLATDDRLPAYQRAVLLMTFDLAYILAADYLRAAADIRLFLKDFPDQNGERRILNHWPDIARILETATCPAIGFYMTSVTPDPWIGPYNEETDTSRPFDWSPTFSVYNPKES